MALNSLTYFKDLCFVSKNSTAMAEEMAQRHLANDAIIIKRANGFSLSNSAFKHPLGSTGSNKSE
jgi:hypothetical protein